MKLVADWKYEVRLVEYVRFVYSNLTTFLEKLEPLGVKQLKLLLFRWFQLLEEMIRIEPNFLSGHHHIDLPVWRTRSPVPSLFRLPSTVFSPP